ncbi:rho GDP-dissociation inhibitor 1-like [Limulus polyphemus]|uniref:Rho GDP-dissociation inhibitor 1-like n=1 Tax=Limulus polyphemus TaxID=6850 RepID=A0ABM1BHC7_LIMPO|nr:rho GDP-dissociation inhibitor 1-like [Limulus polyphemus]XP_022249977.1 rho GDP-dissociation inhibitor 1-like [Limulus polyphemus]
MADDITKENPDEKVKITYRPPAERSLQEIVEADQEDKSLRKYKENLLGTAAKEVVVVDSANPNRVLVKALALVVDGRPDLNLDLSGNLDDLKKKVFIVKEGIQYRIRIDFFVQREIVTGLKYVQRILRYGAEVETITHMVGSYGPKLELQSFITQPEEMPSGVAARGKYIVKSLFTDDDRNEHLKWEWCFEIEKDWE